MLNRQEGIALGAILFLGLGLRLAYVAGMQENPFHHEPMMDPKVHVDWARAIAEGRDGPFADGPFFRAPLYVGFLAAVFKLFGDALLVPRLIQCGLGGLTILLVHRLGRTAFGSTAGLVAAALAATYWVLIYFDAELLIPSLLIPLQLLALWLTLRLADRASLAGCAGAGLAWGVAALARPNALVFMPFVAGWLLVWVKPRWKEGLAAAGVFAAAVCLPIAPVTLHNTLVHGDFVLISSQGGVNFWIGNNPRADGTTAIAPGTRGGWWEGYQDAVTQAEAAEGRPLRASEVSRHYYRRAWDFILGSPDRSLPLLAEKLRLFWTAWEYANNADLHFYAHHFSWVPRVSIGFAVLAPLGLLGVMLSWRDPRLFPLWGFVLVYTLSVVAFFVNARFRAPILPVLMVFAGHALVWFAARLRERRFVRAGLAAGFVVAFGLWSSAQAPDFGRGSNGRVSLASARARQGDVEAARDLLRHALVIDPGHPDAHLRLGALEQIEGRAESALEHYRTAFGRRPMRSDLLEPLLALLVAERQYPEAQGVITAYLGLLRREGIQQHPEIPYYYLGRVLEGQGRAAEAAAAYREALAREPSSRRSARALADLTGAAAVLEPAP